MKKLLLLTLLSLSSSLFTLCYAQYGNGNSGPHGPMTAHQVAASINGGLTQSYLVTNVCGLNYVQATQLTETRTQTISTDTWGTGFPTTLTISALPPSGCASIVKAYLYYGCTFTEATPPTTSATITNPALAVSTIPAALCGTTSDNICWVGNGSATYRADVTSLITGSGNYTVDLNGFANANYEVDGVTLIIVYSDPTAAYNGSMALYDGDLSNDAGVSETFTAGSFTACNASTGTAFALIGDVQANVNGGTNTETYNGNTVVFPNNFWNYCNVPVSLTSGQNSLVYNTYTNNTSDCYFVGVAGLYWQNTTCTTCVPVATTMTLTPNPIAATCANNGVAMVAVAGQTGPLTYSWSPGGSTNAGVTGLSAGTYTVYVSDGNTCASAVETVLNLGMVFTTTNTNATCSHNGSASVFVTGGVTPYTYLWNNSATTSSISVPAGTYTVSISDNSGCTLTTSVTVNNTKPLGVNVYSGNQLLCPPTAGTATVVPTGGTLPYTYLWSPGGQTTATVTGLGWGTYTVTVTDSNGCSASSPITVSLYYSNLTAYTDETPTTCSANNGSAYIIMYGGKEPYTYTWSPGGMTTDSVTGLSAGSYTVSVTDSNGCTLSASVTIATTGPSFTISASPYSLPLGDSTLLSASSSLQPATYQWLPSASVQYADSAKTYATPTVTTTYSCIITTPCGTDTQTVTVNVGCFLSDSMASFPYYCNLEKGSAYVLPLNGTAPYTYQWSPGGQTTQSISGLSAGVYYVLVHDGNGCSSFDSVTISTAAPSAAISASPTHISGGDTTLLSVSSNMPGIYSWAPSVFNPNSPVTYATPTVTTTYTCTIINGCDTITDTVTVYVGACTFTANIYSTHFYCDSSLGTAFVIPSGGNAPYTYLWTPTGQTNQTATGLSVGTYSVVVYDYNGCSYSGSIGVSSASPSFSIFASPSTITPGNSSMLQANINVGATFLWSPAATLDDSTAQYPNASPLVTTTYTCMAITACDTLYDSVTITVSGCFSVGYSSTISMCGLPTASASVFAYGPGIPPYTYLWAPGGQTTATVSGLTNGTYTVTVTDSTGCRELRDVNVYYGFPSYSVSATPDTIFVGDTATLNAYCNGVSATYAWSNGATTSTIQVHPPVTTTYTVTMTSPCSSSVDTITVYVECFGLSVNTTAADCSANNGTASATITGGYAPYTYVWLPSGQTTQTISGLSGGSYTVTVEDSTGCIQSVTAWVPSDTIATLFAIASPDTITVSGGSSVITAYSDINATYLWSNGATTSTITVRPPATTTYRVISVTPCGTDTAYITVYVDSIFCANNYNEPICIVSVDTATGKAEVLWGRTNSPPQNGYGYYNVYKDSTLGFESTHTQPLNVLSEFIDPNSAPATGPVSYELATVDSCGQSALSAVNTTIYLTVTAGVNTYILNWTAYIGFTPTKYYIFRGPSMGALVLIDSTLNSVLTYTDTLPPAGSVYLVEAGDPSGLCVPTARIKPHGAKFNLTGSLSNGFNTVELGVQNIGINLSNLNIYPNPSNGQITIQWSVNSGQSSVRISIYDELGQAVYDNTETQTVGKNTKQLNLGNLAAGVYTLRMQTSGGTMVRKIELMKK